MNQDYLTDSISQAVQALNQIADLPFESAKSISTPALLHQILNSASSLSRLAKQLSIDHTYIKEIANFISLDELITNQTLNQKSKQFELQCESNPHQPKKANLSQNTGKTRGLRGPYNHYSTEFKQNVILLYKQDISCSKISEAFEVPTKNIVRWCRNGAKRKPGAGRKILNPEMQDLLNEWIRQKHEPGFQILIEVVRNKAKELSDKEEFIASLGWFKNFIKRYRLRELYKFK